MAERHPLWRQAFDAIEQPLRKRVESLAATEEFAISCFCAISSTTIGPV